MAFWILIAVFAILSPMLSQGATLLAAITVTAGAVSQIVAQSTGTRAERIAAIGAQLKEFYAPMTPVVEAMLTRPPEGGYLVRFAQHMGRELGYLHRHLATPRALVAFDDWKRSGLADRAEALALASILKEDHERLQREYRRLTGNILG